MKRIRDYQLEAYHAIRNAMRKYKRVCIEICTGGGKTPTLSFVTRDVMAKGGRVLFLVNRDNLCSQGAKQLLEITGKIPSVEKGAERGSRDTQVVVGSVQTMQGERLKNWNRDHFRMVIVDECHFCAGKTFRNIMEHFGDSYWLGVSATLERHDGCGIFFFFEHLAYEFPLIQRSDIVVTTPQARRKFSKLLDAEKYIDKLPDSEALRAKISEEVVPGAIDQGWLVPLKFQQLPVPVTIDETLASKSTLTEDEESFALEPYLQKLAVALADNIQDRKKPLIFLPDCESSMAFSQILRDIGIKCEHVEGVGTRKVYEKGDDGKCLRDAKGEKIVKLTRKFTQEDYDGVIARWKSGETQVVTNATILYIGFDYPEIDCVALLRMIKSTPMIKQMIGRGTRPIIDPASGLSVDSFATAEMRRQYIADSLKPDCLVLDLMLQCDEHNFSKPADLISDFRDSKKKKEDTAKGQGPVDLEIMNETFRKTRVSELEEKLRKVAEKVANQARKKSKGTTIYLHDIVKKPVCEFDVPATQPQMNYIHVLAKRSGFEFPKDIDTTKLTKYQASRIIARMKPKEVNV